jgi:hypothetical protein
MTIRCPVVYLRQGTESMAATALAKKHKVNLVHRWIPVLTWLTAAIIAGLD